MVYCAVWQRNSINTESNRLIFPYCKLMQV